MTTATRDYVARLEAIEPELAKTYAEQLGWQAKDGRPYPDAWILTPPQGIGVVLPRSRDKLDYAAVMDRFVRRVAEQADRDVAVVLADLQGHRDDPGETPAVGSATGSQGKPAKSST